MTPKIPRLAAACGLLALLAGCAVGPYPYGGYYSRSYYGTPGYAYNYGYPYGGYGYRGYSTSVVIGGGGWYHGYGGHPPPPHGGGWHGGGWHGGGWHGGGWHGGGHG